MKRRDFITLLGGTVASRPLAARGQQSGRMRRISVLAGLTAEDSQSQARNAAFLQGLGELGWQVGRNLQIEYRWVGGDTRRATTYAAELIALAPEVILAVGTSVTAPLLAAARSVPVVFVQVSDPVGSGFVASLARPGGNATGFTFFEFGISAKWLELLKEIAPRIARVAVLFDSASPVGFGMLGAIQSVAPSLAVDISPIISRDPSEIEPALAAFCATGPSTDHSSRGDRRSGCAAEAARGLSLPRRQRRLGLVRTGRTRSAPPGGRLC